MNYYKNREQVVEDLNRYFRLCGIKNINSQSTDEEINKAYKLARKFFHPDNHMGEEKKYEEDFKNLNEIYNKYREFTSKRIEQKETPIEREEKENRAKERKEEARKWADNFIKTDVLKSRDVSNIIYKLKRARDSQLDMAIIFKEIYIILNSLQLEKKYFDRIWDLYMENANEGNNIFNLAESIAMEMTDEGHIFNFILTIDEFISRSNQREKMNDDLVDLWVTLIDQGKIKDKKSIYDFSNIFKKDEQILRLIDVLKKQGFEEDTIYFTLQDIGKANGYGSEVLERCLIEFKPDLKELVGFVQYARLTDIKILEYLDSSRPEFATTDVKLELINKIDNTEEKNRRYEIMKNNGELDWRKALKWDNKIYKSDEEPKKPFFGKWWRKEKDAKTGESK